MSFNALLLNNRADISSAFLGSVIDDVAKNLERGNSRVSYSVARNRKDPYFKYYEDQLDKLNTEHELWHRSSPAGGSKATEDYRLVKRCKSPTRSEKEISRRLVLEQQESKLSFLAHSKAQAKRHEKWLEQPESEQTYQKRYISAHEPIIEVKSGLNVLCNKETGELRARSGQRAPIASIWQQEWSGLTRVRVSVQASNSEPPPPQSGERITTALNDRAASKILSSGAYVSVVRGGYTTFLTPTFDKTARYRLANDHYYKIGMGKAGDKISPEVKATGRYTKVEFGKSTIGREMSGFLDAANKMRQRGWVTKLDTVIHSSIGPVKVPANTKVAPSPYEEVRVLHSSFGPVKVECIGAREKLDYLWVAEAPDGAPTVEHSDIGPVKQVNKNPHCHVLMRWNVEPHLFPEWALRFEKLWGNGFAKLQRIHNADAASGYLLKALGYVLKGSAKDQGEIRGNRYNISKPARAPAYECIAQFDAQNMMAIIKEMGEKIRLKDAPVRAKIIKAQSDIAKYQKVYNIQEAIKGRTRAARTITLEKIRNKIDKLKEQANAGYQQIKSRGVRVSDWQITFDKFDDMAKFLGYATAKRDWGANLLTDGEYRNDSPHRPLHDWEHLRESVDAVVETAKVYWDRRYWKGLAAKIEVSEVCWPLQLADANLERDFEGITTDEYYNEYYNQYSEVAA